MPEGQGPQEGLCTLGGDVAPRAWQAPPGVRRGAGASESGQRRLGNHLSAHKTALSGFL